MNKHDQAFFEHKAGPTVAAGGPEEGPMAILAGALKAARRRTVPLAIWLLLCLGAAAWYLHVTPPSYTAAATVILDPKRPTTSVSEPNTQAPVLDAAQAESQIQVLRSERLLFSVFDALDLANSPELRPGPPGLKARLVDAVASLFRKRPDAKDDELQLKAAAFDAFAGRVGARRIGQSYVMEVSYTSGDPDNARKIANAVMSAYLGQQVSYKLAAAQNGAEFLQARITALSNEVKAANAGIMAGTVPAALLPDADARVIGSALEPLGRSAPKSGLVVAFAAAFGLLSGVFAVAVANGLDSRIRSADQLERETGLPCFGIVPQVKRRKGFGRRRSGDMIRLARHEVDGRFAAAIRNIRTSILLALDENRNIAIGVTSWTEGSGCSLLAANLAQVIALSGSTVTLVDADIHRAKGGLTRFGAPVVAGLAESLLDPTGSTMPVATPLDTGVDLVPAHSGESRGVFDAYLGAPALPLLVEAWRARGDIVVDLPSLNSGSDARAAAVRLDAIVVVVEQSRTTAAETARAINALSRVGANVVGTILNRASA